MAYPRLRSRVLERNAAPATASRMMTAGGKLITGLGER
jgi:hypothetical protein